jgi:hypothetical protein
LKKKVKEAFDKLLDRVLAFNPNEKKRRKRAKKKKGS